MNHEWDDFGLFYFPRCDTSYCKENNFISPFGNYRSIPNFSYYTEFAKTLISFKSFIIILFSLLITQDISSSQFNHICSLHSLIVDRKRLRLRANNKASKRDHKKSDVEMSSKPREPQASNPLCLINFPQRIFQQVSVSVEVFVVGDISISMWGQFVKDRASACSPRYYPATYIMFSSLRG